MNKLTINQSGKASRSLLDRARKLGINARIINVSKPRDRIYSACGSTHAPQKIIDINGLSMSIAQAKQYLSAREKRNAANV